MSRMGKLLTGLGGLFGLLASLVTIVQFSEGRWSLAAPTPTVAATAAVAAQPPAAPTLQPTVAPAIVTPTSPPPTTAPPTAPPATPAPSAAPPAAVVAVASPTAQPAASPAAPPAQAGPPTAIAAAGGQASGQAVARIKIVSSLPRSGSNKAETDGVVNAIRQALDETGGRAGGMAVVYEDLNSASSGGDWDAAREAEIAARAVADSEVMLVIGGLDSSAARVAIPILNRANLAMIGLASTYPGLTKPGEGEPGEPEVYYPSGRRSFAWIVPADDVQGAAGARWARQLGATKVYILEDGELYGHGIAASFLEAAGPAGLQVVGGPERIDPKASDYRALSTKVRGAGPELVYFGGLTKNNAGRLFRDLRDVLGPNVRLMAADGVYDQEFLEDAGDSAEGAYITFPGIAPGKLAGRGAEWARAYGARFGSEPGTYAAYGYEATRVALAAIDRGARPDRAAVRDALLATRDYDGVLGRWSFDQNGDTTLSTVSGRQIRRGRFDEANAVVLNAR